ncbi:MAG: adenosylcobalamin-dependent ribonucleoside-diphosphate reductase, partial [Bacteroidales bacterium]|nr:adenosylcobalamin-dependent ribonucleoside-diphosphate reductase [Bacteroidales bacterium]
EVAQDGRRGALMLTISIKHPDAEDFIDAKTDLSKVTGANISVKIDDEFMRCVIEGKPYIQQFPIDSPTPKVTKSIDARKLWQKIIHNAWKSAEPGVIFWDTVLRESVPDSYADLGFKTTSTNPCGEIPLCPYDSCRLLAINLYSYVINPFTKKAYFDFDLFKEHVAYAQRIMDDILDLELENIDKIIAKIDSDPEPFDIKRTERELWVKIKDKAIQGRRTGIGITGEGDMLAALGLQYGSDAAIDFSEEIHKTLALNVYKSSVRLAIDRGAFPIFDFEKEKNNPFINRLFAIDPELEEEMKKHGRRNISMLTIAPTGSVSILTQTTSGIEPVFSIFYKRRRKVNPNDKTVKISFVDEMGDAWEEYNVFHPKFLTWLEINGYSINDITSNFSDDKINELIQQSPYYHATSADVDWVAKVRMQGRIQKYVDHSISVTINLPEKVEENLIDTLYRTAWESGCKGVTVYREGSRSGVLVSANNEKNEFGETHAPKRPKKLEADVIRFVNEDEEWIAVVGLYNNRPYEIFTGKAEHLYIPKDITKGFVIKEKDATMEHARYDFVFYDKDGYEVIIRGLSRTFDPEFWNYAKLISGILRHGMPLLKVIDLVDNLKFDNESINTWKKGVNRALKRYVPDGTRVSESCPQCGAEDSLQYKEGCVVCTNCGYSKCG